MEKQYYAILMRDRNFNADTVSAEERDELSMEAISNLPTKIISKSTNYKDVYNEFQRLKNDYPELLEMADEDLGGSPIHHPNIELSIVRISVMKDWETLK